MFYTFPNIATCLMLTHPLYYCPAKPPPFPPSLPLAPPLPPPPIPRLSLSLIPFSLSAPLSLSQFPPTPTPPSVSSPSLPPSLPPSLLYINTLGCILIYRLSLS